MKNKAKLKKIIDHYGEGKQLEKLQEELNELIVAIVYIQGKLDFVGAISEKECTSLLQNSKELREERADVEIMLDQMKLICNDSEEIELIKKYKVDRTLLRMKNEIRD